LNTIQPLLLPCNGSLDLTLVEITEKVNNLESKILSLFIGLAEIERMPCDREHIIFKMMVGRLYNGKYKLKNLAKTFTVSGKTIRKWGRALLSGDITQIEKAFGGHKNKRKLTAEIEAYARGAFNVIGDRVKNFSQVILNEIESRYNVKLSGESLRPIFNDERMNSKNTCASEEHAPSPSAPEPVIGASPTNQETAGKIRKLSTRTSSLANATTEIPTQKDPGTVTDSLPAPESSLADWETTDEINTMLAIFPASENSGTEGTEITERKSAGFSIEREFGTIEEEAIDNDRKERVNAVPAERFSEQDLIVERQSGASEKREINCVMPESAATKVEAPRKYVPFSRGGLPLSNLDVWTKPVLLKHCGVILFSPWIDLVFPHTEIEFDLERQWLVQLLLGGINVEQNKHLSAESLRKLVGPILKDQNEQRKKLKKRACLDSIIALSSRNGRLIGNGLLEQRILYYDPHTKEYTGMLKYLSTWIAHCHTTRKGIHSDFIHTEDGQPCFVQIFDNFYDLRERFFMCIEAFRMCFPTAEKVAFTWVVDRGIFSMNVLVKIVESGDHIITWEKDYRKDGWRADLAYKRFARNKFKNNSRDRKVVVFEWQEYPWEKNEDFRKIVVRAYKPSGHKIEVSILANLGCGLDAERIIWLLFNKWIQENDFRFLSLFLGIDQITSYRHIPYKELDEVMKDRLVESKEYKKMNKERGRLEKELTKLIRNKYDAEVNLTQKIKLLEKEENDRKVNLNRIQNNIQRTNNQERREKLEKDAVRLAGLLKKYPTRRKKLEEKAGVRTLQISESITEKEICIQKINVKISRIMKDESRLHRLIKDEYFMPDVRAKNYMDMLKITARNIFYKLLEVFRPLYDNYRDDCALLREITRLSGIVVREGGRISVKLWAQADYQPRQLSVITTFLRMMTQFINANFKDKFAPVKIEILPSTIVLDQLSGYGFLGE